MVEHSREDSEKIRRGEGTRLQSEASAGNWLQFNFPRKVCSSNYVSSSHLEGCGTWPLQRGNSHLAKGKSPEKSASLSCSHNTSSNESEVPLLVKGIWMGHPKCPPEPTPGIAQIRCLLTPSTPVQARLFQGSGWLQFLGKLKREEG